MQAGLSVPRHLSSTTHVAWALWKISQGGQGDLDEGSIPILIKLSNKSLVASQHVAVALYNVC